MKLYNMDEWKKVIRCALISGKVVGYDYCLDCNTMSFKDAKQAYYSFKYIGTGTVHSVNGIIQSDTRQFYFFVKP